MYFSIQIDQNGSEQVLGETLQYYLQSLASCLIWFVVILLVDAYMLDVFLTHKFSNVREWQSVVVLHFW